MRNQQITLESIKKQKSTADLLEFGIINIDKPSGPTSFQVSEKVKLLLGLRKTSHFGTLDPKVTGVLPVALNRGCKLTGFFLGHDKEYVGVMRLHEEVERKKVEEAIQRHFTGIITQLPPVRSRVKRAEREREIKTFELLEQDKKDFLFRGVVQGGTYIRKLLHDLGETLGVGAHMLELRRTRAGIIREDDALYPSVTLYELEQAIAAREKGDDTLLRAMIIPGEIVKEIYPVVELKKEAVEGVLHGKPIHTSDISKKFTTQEEYVSVFCATRFIGVFRVAKEKDIFARSAFTMQNITS